MVSDRGDGFIALSPEKEGSQNLICLRTRCIEPPPARMDVIEHVGRYDMTGAVLIEHHGGHAVLVSDEESGRIHRYLREETVYEQIDFQGAWDI